MPEHHRDLLQERRDRIARNQQMLQGVVVAASEIEQEEARADAASERRAEARRAARQARILASTQAAGPRQTSKRASTVAAKQRIAAAFERGLPSCQCQLLHQLP